MSHTSWRARPLCVILAFAGLVAACTDTNDLSDTAADGGEELDIAFSGARVEDDDEVTMSFEGTVVGPAGEGSGEVVGDGQCTAPDGSVVATVEFLLSFEFAIERNESSLLLTYGDTNVGRDNTVILDAEEGGRCANVPTEAAALMSGQSVQIDVSFVSGTQEIAAPLWLGRNVAGTLTLSQPSDDN